MEFPAFEHATFLDRAWKHRPRHNLGSSSFIGGSWQARGLPALPQDFDSQKVNLSAEDDLRTALSRHVGVAADRVFASAGTSAANLATMLWAFRPGCNFVVERPFYAPLAATAQGVGADVRFVDRRREEEWRLHPDDVAAATDDDTALVVLASPSNPTQAVASAADLRAFAAVADEHGCHVLVDQVYRELTDHPIAAQLHDRLITTAGFNKSWGIPGIRIGWLAARADVAHAVHNVHMQTVMAPSTPFETVAARLLALAAKCRRQLEDRLAQTVPVYRDWLAATPVVDDVEPHHLTAFPRLPVADTKAFCERIAADAGVVVVPGEYFGRSGLARIGLGGDADALSAGLEALARCLP